MRVRGRSLHLRLTCFLLCLKPIPVCVRNLARVNPIERQHNRQHEHRIEDVQKDLFPKQKPRVPLLILDDSERAPHQDQAARHIQGDEMALPRQRPQVDGAGRRALVPFQREVALEPVVERPRDEDEDTKEEELQTQADQHELFTDLHALLGPRAHDAAAPALH